MPLISRRQVLKSSAVLATALALPAWLLRAAESDRKPNIVFILMDDMGSKDAACLGSDLYETPNIDRLASQGMTFTQAYAPAPNCAPSRACIMTGQYTPRHGIYTVGASDRGPAKRRKIIPTPNATVLAPEKVTMAESLKAAGYATFLGGKWHLGDGPKTGPTGQGFDVNFGGCDAGQPPGGYFGPWNAPGLTDAPKGAHLGDFITDKAIDFLKGHADKPFFLYLPFYDVHAPLQAKPELIDKYKKKLADIEAKGAKPEHHNATYAAMVETADTNIGRVMKALDDLKLTDDTFVLFFSDNGGFGNATSQRPLRGCKGMLYEGGVREPAIIRWPGRVKPAAKCDTPIIGVDFFPTFAQIAGAKPPDAQPLDGLSILPLLQGAPTPPALADRPLFWHCPVYLDGTPPGFAADAPDPSWRSTPCGSIRQGDWKLIEYFDDGRLELYNLKDDPSERKNLAAAQPQKAKDLLATMKQWRQSTKAPVPTEPEPRYDPKAAPPGPGRTITPRAEPSGR